MVNPIRNGVAEAGVEGPGQASELRPHTSGSGEDPDESLIRWMLGLTVDERMAVAQRFVDDVARLRPAGVPDDDATD